MKKILILGFSLVFFVLATNVNAEEILDFEQVINLDQDSSFLVQEIITYDFGSIEKHGIIRDIPFKYQARGGTYKVRISDVEVTKTSGEAWNFKIINNGDLKRIQIGEADEYVSGKQVYRISYKVRRAINFFEDESELYWNVTGTNWPVTIRQSKATVVLPQAVDEDELRATCYTGYAGESNPCVSSRYEYKSEGMVSQIHFIDDIMQAGKGMTIVVGMPHGLIEKPGLLLRAFDIARDNFIVLLPLLVFAYMFRHWQRKGRDPEGRGVVIAQFDAPDKLSPMGVGTLIDERADNKDFSANIINLAIKGYLRILKLRTGLILKSDDYALVKLEGTAPLRKSEKMIYDAIFKKKNLESNTSRLSIESNINNTEIGDMVLMSNLKNVFYKDLKKIKDSIYKELYEEGYFVKNPNTVRGIYMVIGVVVLIFAIPLGMSWFGVIGLVSLVLSAIMVMVFGYFMPKKTKKGAEAVEHIKGLRMYLDVAEKDRLDFHNAPEKNPKTFEKLLPYAMVLGVEDKWAKQFEGIYNEQPDWYQGGNMQTFSAAALASDMGSFRANAVQAASSTPSSASSGGSGFSGGGVGGGFGGGGGGSW